MPQPPQRHILPVDFPRVRLDQWLAKHLEGPSRTEIQSWIREGLILVDDQRVPPGFRLKGGMAVEISLPETKPVTVPEPEDLPLEILYEDASLVVINKQPGWVAHPAPGHPAGTVLNAVLHHFPDVAQAGPPDRPGLVHRLDADTSGVLLFARTSADLEHLQSQFRNRQTEKRYECICKGIPHPVSQRIDLPIGRHPVHRKKRAVNGLAAKEARTYFRMIRGLADGKASHLSVGIETGRTHQIRVHLESLGHPVLGDRIYGGRQTQLPKPSPPAPRLLLHACQLGIRHPQRGDLLSFEAPLPEDFRSYLELIS